MMRRKLLYSLFLFIGIFGTIFRLSAADRQLLHDGWEFRQARLSNKYPATVPGVVHLDLLENGLIDDPFFRLNERSVQWVDKEDWVYQTTFVPSPDIFEKENIDLVFKGLDTYADVYLNGEKILTADNMFREWAVGVKPFLKSGDNTLKVYFHSPIKTDMPKLESLPYHYEASNDQSENGGVFDRKLSVFARKAGYHYGWDWGPRLVTSGIWRDVYLEEWNDARIENVFIRQHDVSKNKADVSDVVEIMADKDIDKVVVSIKDSDTERILASKVCDLKKGLNTVSLDFSIKNPRLWWCNGLGKQNMYNFTTSVSLDNKVIASDNERVGIRSIKVVTEPDSDGNMQFYFVLNGVPVFAKGTNYIPQDNFLPRVNEEKYRKTIEDAAEANMNMIRIWGGGIYENDVFYDICDELGLMVWQDFMFACSIYPATGEWLENVRLEARDNLRRLRNHPCIVLWCGGNECIDAWYNWGWKYEHEKENAEYAGIIEEELTRQYFEVLPEAMAQYAPDTFYWPSSPFSANGRGSDGINGDRHYWDVWHQRAPIDSYNKDRAHFFSEYGMQSFPEYSSILKFAPALSDHDIISDVMMSHQRGGDDANRLIEWYLLNEYRQPTDFEEFLYMNQVLQGDAMRTAIEAHRRDKPYCMGSLMWQHNDCWPAASWSTRDYYGRWKAAHYMARKAFGNVIISAGISDQNIRIYGISDILENVKGTLEIKVLTLDGNNIFNKKVSVNIPANTSVELIKFQISELLNGCNPEDVAISLRLNGDKNCYDGNYFLCKQKDMNYHPAEVKTAISEIDGGYRICVSSNTFVRALCLYVDGIDNRFDNNYFDLLPNEAKSCTIMTDMPLEEFKANLKYRNLNQSYQ